MSIDPAHAYALWASTYAPTAHTPLMRVEERAVRALLPDLRGVTVLDVGCGTGRYLAVAKTLGARRLIGIDPSAAMLSRVDVPEACVMRGDVERLPLGAEAADVTICALTLGHVTSLSRAFGELARVTRAGGVLICSELHPIGAALGWRRTFTAQGRHYSVRDAGHSLDDWLSASAAAGWTVQARSEPTLQRDDVPAGVTVDARALTVPSALVLRLVRSEITRNDRWVRT
jgi:malonyl-CoA O-methyltransferase